MTISGPVKSRGTALVQVLIMSLLMMYLAMLLLRTVINQWTIAGQTVTSTNSHKMGDTMLNLVQSQWNPMNAMFCKQRLTFSGDGITNCNPIPGTPCTCIPPSVCSCVCDAIIHGVTYNNPHPINVNSCRVSINSSY